MDLDIDFKNPDLSVTKREKERFNTGKSRVEEIERILRELKRYRKKESGGLSFGVFQYIKKITKKF